MEEGLGSLGGLGFRVHRVYDLQLLGLRVRRLEE